MRILLADDDRFAADELVKYFGGLGHEVSVAYDGEHALMVAAALLLELAVLDINMPLCDAYEVARQLRASDLSGTLVLAAISGLGRESDERNAIKAGFHYFFVKPVDPALLQALVQRGAGSVDSPE